MAPSIHVTRCIVLIVTFCPCRLYSRRVRICNSSWHSYCEKPPSKILEDSTLRLRLSHLLFASGHPSIKGSPRALGGIAREIHMMSTSTADGALDQADDGLSMLSVDELKELLSMRGVLPVQLDKFIEKRDFVEALQDCGGGPQAALHLGTTDEEERRVSVFEQASPAVAYINEIKFSNELEAEGSGSMWNILKKAAFSEKKAASSELEAEGSGFVWDMQGHVVTTFDVLLGNEGIASGATLFLRGVDQPLDAAVVGYDVDKNIAVLKIDPTSVKQPLVPIRIGNSSSLAVGQPCLAIGSPRPDLRYTLTVGIVSSLGAAVKRMASVESKAPIEDCIRTTATINFGDDGGPLLDYSGLLIGLTISSGADSNIGGGAAIPVNIVSSVVDGILKSGLGSI